MMVAWIWVLAQVGWSGELPTIEDQQQVTVEYKLAFDMDERGDAACKLTQLCDCTARYTGGGKQVRRGENFITFKGTWKNEESTCSDSFEPWAPAEETAFHTLRWDAGTKKLTEWIVHANQDKNERLESGIKEGEQYWISEMGVETTLNPETLTLTYVEKTEEKVSVLSVDTSHELTLRFKPKGGGS